MIERRAVLVLVWLLAWSAARAAAATPDDKLEARRHFDVGVARAKAGAYREAVEEFMQAYRLSPNFAVLYNVATAQAALGDPAAAVTTYERYLDEGGVAVPAQRSAKVTAEIKRLAARTGLIVAPPTPETAQVTVDGAPVEAAVAARGVRVNAGLHRVGATAAGYVPAEETVTVAAGAVVAVALALAPATVAQEAPPPPVAVARPPPLPTRAAPPLAITRPVPPPAAPPPPPASATRTIGYALGVAGLVALAAGGALYLNARSDLQKAIDAGCTQAAGSCTRQGMADWNSAQDGVRNSRIAAVAGAILLAGGVTLLVLSF